MEYKKKLKQSDKVPIVGPSSQQILSDVILMMEEAKNPPPENHRKQ